MTSDYTKRKDYYKEYYQKKRQNKEWVESQKKVNNEYKKGYQLSGKRKIKDEEWRTSYIGKKSIKISEWKTKQKWKETDERFNYIFNRWYEAEECELCHTRLTTKNKCCDHEHNTGTFRCVCCVRCNNKIGVVDRNRMLVCLAIHRYSKVKTSA